MFTLDRLLDEVKRLVSIPSDAYSGNEELARYLQSLMQDLGFKVQLQPVHHSLAGLSKRQYNLIGYSSDNLVDRSTRRGLLLVNPLDVTTGNLNALWTETQGEPYRAYIHGQKLVGAGALQGKVDFMCRVIAAAELLERRHKVPLYLVGTAGSQFGMLGARFLVESLSVNPKEVITFAPTQLKTNRQAPGHVAFSVEIESPTRDRDSRGYNRCVHLEARGRSIDFSAVENGINAFDLLMELLLEASAQGFDYQWSKLETMGAEGAVPDLARATLYLTAFQYEDFKQFTKNKMAENDQHQYFNIEYVGATDHATSFLSASLIEVILELDFEWKALVSGLSLGEQAQFQRPHSVGMLTQIQNLMNGKTAVRFELRHLPQHSLLQIEAQWKEKIQTLFHKYKELNFNLQKERLCYAMGEPVSAEGSVSTNYASDAGWFAKSKFPVSVIGLGGVDQFPKGPNEFVRISQIEEAIQFYRDLILSVCL